MVRIVAPSGPFDPEAFEKGLAVLRDRLGLVPRMRDDIHARTGYLAGDDTRRLAEWHEAASDPEARAIWCARGGYGAMRLLPRLEAARIFHPPKVFVGFSDITALHVLLNRNGLVTVHGPVVTQLGGLPDDDQAALFRLLEEPSPGLLLKDLEGVVPGRARGPLVGGNLEVFSRLLGTPFMPDVEGAILLLEDLGERPYRIDRLLTHLDSAGVFSAVAGVVVGDFSGCVEPEATRASQPTAVEVIEERLSRLAIPVAIGAPVGHGTRNVALPHGAMVELDARFGTLHAVEGAVS